MVNSLWLATKQNAFCLECHLLHGKKGMSVNPPNPLYTSGSVGVALNFYFITDPHGESFHIEIKMGGIGFVLF